MTKTLLGVGIYETDSLANGRSPCHFFSAYQIFRRKRHKRVDTHH